MTGAWLVHRTLEGGRGKAFATVLRLPPSWKSCAAFSCPCCTALGAVPACPVRCDLGGPHVLLCEGSLPGGVASGEDEGPHPVATELISQPNDAVGSG